MVAICCREAMNVRVQSGLPESSGNGRTSGAVGLTARFYFPVAKSREKRIEEGQRHCQRPDLDNCIKSIKDGLNGVAWNDDCCVCEVVASKHWTHLAPRAEITVEEL